MDQNQWYEVVFENFGNQYDKEVFTQGTIGECDFIEQELPRDKSLRLLDVGCGTGRHSIELTKRGYRVTAIDLSYSMLAKAREKAEKQLLKIDFLKQDARNLSFENEFDVAIMLCEGAFPLMETDEMNFEILRNVTKSLKVHGKLIFTTLNGLFPLTHSVEGFANSKAKEPGATFPNKNFDLMSFREHSLVEIKDDYGNIRQIETNERYYMPSEITWLLKSLGYRKIEIFGAKLGAFSRKDFLTTEDFEMLVLAQK